MMKTESLHLASDSGFREPVFVSSGVSDISSVERGEPAGRRRRRVERVCDMSMLDGGGRCHRDFSLRKSLTVCWIGVHAFSTLVSMKRKQCGGNCTMVENDDLFALGCSSF
jgi:hypothetical protein